MTTVTISYAECYFITRKATSCNGLQRDPFCCRVRPGNGKKAEDLEEGTLQAIAPAGAGIAAGAAGAGAAGATASRAATSAPVIVPVEAKKLPLETLVCPVKTETVNGTTVVTPLETEQEDGSYSISPVEARNLSMNTLVTPVATREEDGRVVVYPIGMKTIDGLDVGAQNLSRVTEYMD